MAELADKEIKVSAKTSDGKIILDKNVKTLWNGFLELWLPRNKKIDITLTYNGKKAAQTLDTGSSGATCITNMKLE